jgi:NitT/TauT family transport system substrate-binding protein
MITLTSCGQNPLAGSNASNQPTSTNGPVIGLTYIPNIQFAPFYLADDHGWTGAAAGASLRHHGSSEGLFTALTTGTEQMVVAGGDEILQARASGIDVMAVASYYAQYPARLIVPADSAINSVTDLRGHSVGLPKFGENWFALQVALHQAGLTEDDVDVEDIGFTQQTALTTGKVDAVVGFANSDVLAFAAAGFAVRAIDLDVPLVSICLATSSTYAQAHPETVTTVIAAMRQGMTQAKDDPKTAIAVAAGYIPSFRGDAVTTAEQILPATTALFTDPRSGVVSPPLDSSQWTAMSQAMTGVDLLDQAVDVEAAFSNAYQPQ